MIFTIKKVFGMIFTMKNIGIKKKILEMNFYCKNTLRMIFTSKIR